MRLSYFGVVLTLAALAAPASGQLTSPNGMIAKGGTDDYGPYMTVPNWLKPVREGFLEKGVSVWAETPDHIFVTTSVEFPDPAAVQKVQQAAAAARAAAGFGTAGGGGGGGFGGGSTAGLNIPAPRNRALVSIHDREGNVKEVWTQWEDLMVMPHYVTISPFDPEKNVWVVSRETDQIFKFTHDGKKLLMTLGEDRRKMPACPSPQGNARCNGGHLIQQDAGHFGQPTAVAFFPNGDFLISDGYTNRRVAKYDKNGKFLMDWGGVGTGPGQFAADGQVHSVAIDANRKVYVADRGNNRIQVFDENGKFLDSWENVTGASDIKITTDGFAWVTSGRGNRLAKYDLNGKLITYWGTYGMDQGQFDDPHYISVDQEGNLYVAIFSNTKVGVEKYMPRSGADRTRLIGQFVVPGSGNAR